MNYYDIAHLPLDPLVREPAVALRHLEAHLRIWNTQASGPKGVLYRHYREMAPEMRAAFSSACTLSRLGESAWQREQHCVLEHLRMLAGTRGIITHAELERLSELHPRLRRITMTGLVIKQGFRIRCDEDTHPPLPSKPALPAGVRLPTTRQLEEIVLNLSVLGKKTLYELVCCHPETPLDSLNAAVIVFKEKSCYLPKGTARADACNTLSIIMSSVFADEASRRGFNHAMRIHLAQVNITPLINLLVAGGPPAISQTHYRCLIQQLTQLGLTREEAEWMVFDECCNKRKAAFPVS